MDDSRWYILRVKPGCEYAVAADCGAPAYVPRQRVKKLNRRMRKVVSFLCPLFPGMIFVKLRAPSDFSLFAPSKVFGFLRNGDRTPAILTSKAFEALRRVEHEANEKPEPVVEVQSRIVKAGETVGVQMAQFADAVMALIEEIKGNKVFVRILQSNLRVETTLGKLVA